MSQSTTAHVLIALDGPRASQASLVGPKAAHLAQLLRAGLPVPPGFVIRSTLAMDDQEVRQAIRVAFGRLRESGTPYVAVRSSATAEDLPDASFAGQQETVLHVGDVDSLFQAIARVRASLHSRAATAYQEHAGIIERHMAVLVQHQIDAVVSGVAFSHDPITGASSIVIEAVAGLGEAFTAGRVDPQRWYVSPDGDITSAEAQGRTTVAETDSRHDNGEVRQGLEGSLLPETILREIARLVQRAEAIFETPQDVEWSWDGEQLWILQARPITARRNEDFFTAHYDGDTWLWTAAFLNERFVYPVSPLGWTVVADLFEHLALRYPLSLLEANDLEGPLLKLWRGHPYSRVEAWQRLYKLFPQALLPEDAGHYFPADDVSLRRAPRAPHWGLHLFWNGLVALMREGRGGSPFHNPAAWQAFERRLDAYLDRLTTEVEILPRLPTPLATQTGRRMLQEAQSLTEELLRLHRWSLLYADVTYGLLRRALRTRFGPAKGAQLAAAFTADVNSKTAQLNRALTTLARTLARRPALLERLAGVETVADIAATLDEDDPFLLHLRRFLDRYGHRFFTLDLADPPYEAAPQRLVTLLRTQAEALATPAADEASTESQAQRRPPIWLRPFLRLTRAYIRLREDQRFAWQRILALQRRIALRLGEHWTEAGYLEQPEAVFGLTWDELVESSLSETLGAVAERRLTRHRRLCEQFEMAPSWHYPAFLRGDHPLLPASSETTLRGRPVSPGLARGRVCIVTSADEFDRLQKGDILVTLAADPGWTPVFETIAGLLTERGGQLSHAAVVAREYGVPAVAGVKDLLQRLQPGEEVLVDGTEGVIRRLGREV